MATPAQDQPTASGELARAIEAERQAVCEGLTTCRRGLKPKAVHALRVACRRLQSALELAAAIGCEARPGLRRRLKKLLRALAPLRDAQVQLQALKSLPFEPQECVQLSTFLRREQHRSARDVRRRVRSLDLADLERRLSRVVRELKAIRTDAASRAAVETALHGWLAGHYLGIERQQETLQLGDADALHELRLALKSYRYALDALAFSHALGARELSVATARLQQQLGAAHDARVLAALVRSHVKPSSEVETLIRQLDDNSQAAQLAGATAVKLAQLRWPDRAPT